MKITLDELEFCKRNNIRLEDFVKEKARLKREQKMLNKLIEQRYDLEDALDVLEDEAGSERWKRKKDELEKVNAQIETLWSKMTGQE